jgi:AcrR family transcriptional regulator
VITVFSMDAVGGMGGAGGDWRARMIGRSVGPAADQAMRRSLAIVTAAARVIHRSGSDDFTMRQVAEEAELSLRAVYKLFAGKDELLAALTEEAQVVLAHLLERRVGAYEDPLERLGAALYFSTDPRQHTDHDYNTAVARYAVQLSITAPDKLFRARRSVMQVFMRLIDEAMGAGQIAPGDSERAACSVYLTYHSFQMAGYLGNSSGAALPTNEEIIEFCLRGLGAQLPAGWVERLRVSDEDAARYRHESEHAAGTLPRAGARSSESA